MCNSVFSFFEIDTVSELIVVANYHEPGEGRCELDRYFGNMAGHERRFKIQGLDILGNDMLISVPNLTCQRG